MMTRFRITAFVAALAGVLAVAPAMAQEALAIGTPIPLADRSMQNANGAATTFTQQMGPRGLVVVFWSNTCPWVRRYEARVGQLADEYMRAGLGFILVNPNDATEIPGDGMEAMREHASASGYGFPYVVDAGSEAARAFGATRTPQVFVFGANGRLVYEGAIDDSPADARQVRDFYMRDALAAVVSGEAVQVEKTRAFGCTIKFHE